VDIGVWLRSLDMEQYEQAFHENAIDAAVLPELTADDLRELGVRLVGHRRKLLAAIAALRSDSDAAAEAGAAPPHGRATTVNGDVLRSHWLDRSLCAP
jgi:hypothetical protein